MCVNAVHVQDWVSVGGRVGEWVGCRLQCTAVSSPDVWVEMWVITAALQTLQQPFIVSAHFKQTRFLPPFSSDTNLVLTQSS